MASYCIVLSIELGPSKEKYIFWLQLEIQTQEWETLVVLQLLLLTKWPRLKEPQVDMFLKGMTWSYSEHSTLFLGKEFSPLMDWFNLDFLWITPQKVCSAVGKNGCWISFINWLEKNILTFSFLKCWPFFKLNGKKKSTCQCLLTRQIKTKKKNPNNWHVQFWP